MSSLSLPSQMPLTQQEVQSPVAVSGKLKEAKAAAVEFEGVFIGEMMKIMLETVPEDSRFGGGNAERIYKGLMAGEMGSAISAKGGVGLAPHVLQAIIERQGGQ